MSTSFAIWEGRVLELAVPTPVRIDGRETPPLRYCDDRTVRAWRWLWQVEESVKRRRAEPAVTE